MGSSANKGRKTLQEANTEWSTAASLWQVWCVERADIKKRFLHFPEPRWGTNHIGISSAAVPTFLYPKSQQPLHPNGWVSNHTENHRPRNLAMIWTGHRSMGDMGEMCGSAIYCGWDHLTHLVPQRNLMKLEHCPANSLTHVCKGRAPQVGGNFLVGLSILVAGEAWRQLMQSLHCRSVGRWVP